MTLLPWSVVRKDTGEVVATFKSEASAHAVIPHSVWQAPLEVRSTIQPTCGACKWWNRYDKEQRCALVEGQTYLRCTPADFCCSLHSPKEAPDATRN